MDKKQKNITNKAICLIFPFVIIILTSCTQKGLPNTNSDITTKSTINSQTSPNNTSWKTISGPVFIRDILDFNLEDVSSITIIKYKDNIKRATVNISNQKTISEVKKLICDFSVMQTKEKLQTNNIVYEIYFEQTKDLHKYLSITSIKNEKEFAVGGSFIDINKINPLQLLIQTNLEISFNNIQKILEAMITAK